MPQNSHQVGSSPDTSKQEVVRLVERRVATVRVDAFGRVSLEVRRRDGVTVEQMTFLAGEARAVADALRAEADVAEGKG